MSEHDALLAAILTKPADDDARLVYADWLDDNDQPDRAEFIRVQIEIAQREARCAATADGLTRAGVKVACIEFGPEIDALRTRERELSLLVAEPICAGLAIRWTAWSRGFVSQVTCSSEDWIKYADQIFWHPDQKLMCIGGCWRSLDGICRTFDAAGPDSRWETCPTCNGTGGISRPFVSAAHPIERVVLTSPAWVDLLGQINWSEGYITFTSPKWPGVVFEPRYE